MADLAVSSLPHLIESIENMCRDGKTGELCCYSGHPKTFWDIWHALEIPEKYMTQEPYYNLVIWDTNNLSIHLETDKTIEAQKNRIIPSLALEDSDDEADLVSVERCTVWKYTK